MKSDIEIKDDIYQALKGSALEQAVSGTLRKRPRKKDSKKEDIIISVLANEQNQRQEAYVNVNIYVPDIIEDGEWVENSPRLKELCRISWQCLETGGIGKDFRFAADKQRVFEVNGTNEHFINNKVKYQIINE